MDNLSATGHAEEFRERGLPGFLNAEDIVWQKDSAIMRSNTDYWDSVNGADASAKVDATRRLYSEFNDLARENMDGIQNLSNFYVFDQQRAKDATAYRKAIQAELDTISDNISRLASLPRSNQ